MNKCKCAADHRHLCCCCTAQSLPPTPLLLTNRAMRGSIYSHDVFSTRTSGEDALRGSNGLAHAGFVSNEKKPFSLHLSISIQAVAVVTLPRYRQKRRR